MSEKTAKYFNREFINCQKDNKRKYVELKIILFNIQKEQIKDYKNTFTPIYSTIQCFTV